MGWNHQPGFAAEKTGEHSVNLDSCKTILRKINTSRKRGLRQKSDIFFLCFFFMCFFSSHVSEDFCYPAKIRENTWSNLTGTELGATCTSLCKATCSQWVNIYIYLSIYLCYVYIQKLFMYIIRFICVHLIYTRPYMSDFSWYSAHMFHEKSTASDPSRSCCVHTLRWNSHLLEPHPLDEKTRLQWTYLGETAVASGGQTTNEFW